MQRCYKCNVNINSGAKICPLCKNELKIVSKEHEDVFPYIPIEVKHVSIWYRLLGLVLLLNVSICVLVDYIINNKITWSIFVILANLCVGISIYVGIKYKKSLSALLFTEYILLAGISYFWDYITNMHNWSLDYVLPILSIIFIVLNFILKLIFRKQRRKYVGNVLFASVVGIICAVLLSFNIITFAPASYVSAIIGVFAIITSLVFDGRKIIEEFKKRMHI